MGSELEVKIFGATPDNFEAIALELFRFQYDNNPLYRRFAGLLGKKPGSVRSCAEIPFLPISFFKSHAIVSGAFSSEVIFESSGTTGQARSRHLVKSMSLYKRSFTEAFIKYYGNPEDWCVIGLLPSYLERSNSSLVVMVDELIRLSGHPQSGFYLYEPERLYHQLQELEAKGQKTWLIGVSFALLDFAGAYAFPLQHTVLIETGGMKGRKEEMVRKELHELLKKSFGLNYIHSEYGMTELLSQAYSKGEGVFSCPPWMKVLVREEDDPLCVTDSSQLKAGQAGVNDRSQPGADRLSITDSPQPGSGRLSLTDRSQSNAGRLNITDSSQLSSGRSVSGIINVIDLANIYSCAFIATDDAGRLYADDRFEVAGRMDNSDIRGCSLLVS